MKQMLRKLLTVIPMLALLVSLAVPTPASAACNERFFTFPNWYKGLVDSTSCEITGFRPADQGGMGINAFWVIVLNLIEIGFQLIAYFAVGYIIWGGFKYIKSEGNPSKVGDAKQAILYAIIGLGVALTSTAMVNFVSRSFQTS